MSDFIWGVVSISFAVLSGFFFGWQFARINMKTPKEWYEHGQWWCRAGELDAFGKCILIIFGKHGKAIPEKTRIAIMAEIREAMKKTKEKG